MLSYIQQKIIKNLLNSEGLKYSQARPEDTKNDLYNYHLQFLVKKGFVTKNANKYFLSEKGKKYSHRMDVKGQIYSYRKMSVIAHVVRKKEDLQEILLQKRKRQPYFDDIGAISGKILPGEKIETAAERKLKEETGLKAKFRFIGVIRKMRRNKQKEVIEDTLYHVCYANNPSGKLIEKNEYGEHFWTSFDKAIKLQRKNKTAGDKTETTLKRLRDENFQLFYFTEDIIIR